MIAINKHCKNYIKKTAIYVVLCLVSACASSFRNEGNTIGATQRDEIVFFRDGFKEYEWKQYDDTVKVKKPRIIGVKGIHNLEYKLKANSLKILKHEYTSGFRKPTDVGELFYEQQLSKQQRQEFERIMRQINLEEVRNANASGPDYMVEDGFQLNVLLTKAGQQEKIFWNNKYVEDLISLLIIANDLSPEIYKFYTDEKAFVQSLKESTR